VLVGRDSERQAVAEVLDAARRGSGGAIVVRGVSGCGKSTLLADAAAAANGMQVLRTQGVESESPLAFAALQRLLRPLRRRVERLPGPQANALRAAFGEAEGDGDRFLTFLATLSLLADAAEEAPVLAVIDDAHWLDDASAAALQFAARRLNAEPVAMVFATREGEESTFDSGDLPLLPLGAVAGEAAGEVLQSRGVEVAAPVRNQLVTATGGNLLALVELAAVLNAEQLAGREPLPDPLPLTEGVERAFLERTRRLGPAAQRLLLVAATDDSSRAAIVIEAARQLEAGSKALDDVERAGLLRIDGATVELRHPLVRSAVYRGATTSERHAAHRALATALLAAGDRERATWHRAASAETPDTDVVDELDAVAAAARARGGHEAASAAWSRAAELTSDAQARGRRLYLSASSAWLGAQPARGAALAAAAESIVSDPLLRAQLLTLQGQIEWNTRSLNEGYDLILQAAESAAGADETMTQQLTMLAASLAAFGAQSPRPFDPAALVTEPASDAPARVRAAYLLLQGFRAISRKDFAAAADFFGRAFVLVDTDPLADDHVLQPNLAIAAWLIDDDGRNLRLHDNQLTAARRAGALSMVDHALTRGFFPQFVTGAWANANAAAAEGLSLASSAGQRGQTALPLAELALIAALRGDEIADRHLDDVAAVREADPVGITDALVVDLARWATALRAGPQTTTALHHLEQITLPFMRRMAALDVFSVAARSGRQDVLRSWVAEIGDFAGATATASAVAAAAHGRALLDQRDADEHFRRALTAHADSPRLFDRARTELAFGEHLRRTRHRVEARPHLRSALTLFEELGANPWAERANQELRASGETARRREAASSDALTPQERQVAALVRQGLSNRDAAAQLFLSPRTVDFHLRNVFAKLGVTSRSELAAMHLD
jgi:DNA-binding CsgD family transcriptional regulator